MFNFFANEVDFSDNRFFIRGNDFNHIKNALRMKTGDTFLVSCDGTSHLCSLLGFEDDAAVCEIIEEDYNNTELPIRIYLFQGLPKSDKLELIIQKAVELGAHSIIPTEMEHCVVRLDDKKKASRRSRWQTIAESAAKQSKRNIVPEIKECMSYKQALDFAKTLDLLLVPYESADGMAATKKALKKIKGGMSVGIIIGAEGGFSQAEIQAAKNVGGEIISLGKRILRTETAAISAVSLCMLYAETELD